MSSSIRLHASCVVLENRAVLIGGPSGVGKSDVALRLIDGGARLVSDDQTEVRLDGDKLIASPPPTIAGLIEIRHAGIYRLPFCTEAEVALYVDLVAPETSLERYPEPDPFFVLDHPLPKLRLRACESSTPAKIRATLLFPLVE